MKNIFNSDNKKNKKQHLKYNLTLLIIFVFVCFFIIALFVYFIPKYQNNKNVGNNQEDSVRNTFLNLNKTYCYSSAYAINNSENKAMWDLSISQFTDIALWITSSNIVLNNESKVWIDSISFSNMQTGNLSLSHLALENFGKASQDEFLNKTQSSRIDINDNLFSYPITLRYLNYNLTTDSTIMDIKEPLTFDGSLLKKARIPISSIKNKVSFVVHILQASGSEYSLPVTIDIPLQDENKTKSIYDGNYIEEKIY